MNVLFSFFRFTIILGLTLSWGCASTASHKRITSVDFKVDALKSEIYKLHRAHASKQYVREALYVAFLPFTASSSGLPNLDGVTVGAGYGTPQFTAPYDYSIYYSTSENVPADVAVVEEVLSKMPDGKLTETPYFFSWKDDHWINCEENLPPELKRELERLKAW
jgi:hypothetical protein